MNVACAARLSVHELSEIQVDGKTIPYTLKRSPRARHARLEVRAETGLTVVVPFAYPRSRVPEIIKEKKRWVLAKLEQFSRGKRDYSPGGNRARYLGRQLNVKREAVVCPQNKAILVGDELVLRLKADCDSPKGIETWLKHQAESTIKEMVKNRCPKIGVTYHSVRIGSARTRWGSCSPRGALCFNWKLIMAPLPVIEYVVVHELCHLKELNHSKSFWGLVEKHCPDWRLRRKWLRLNEAALTL